MTKCNNCTEGHIPLGEHFVTHDMAMDAGDMSLVGQSMGVEWGGCPCCEGNWQECKNCTEGYVALWTEKDIPLLLEKVNSFAMERECLQARINEAVKELKSVKQAIIDRNDPTPLQVYRFVDELIKKLEK